MQLSYDLSPFFRCPISQVNHKLIDLFARGIPQGFCAAEFDGICLHQIGIELMLSDELAEAISYKRTASL